jgi:hypothetical protein
MIKGHLLSNTQQGKLAAGFSLLEMMPEVS